MTTTNANNTSKLAPPPLMSATAEKSAGLVTGYFRQSSDGANFTVTPVYMHPTDLSHAVGRSPGEYSLTATGFSAWTAGNNSAQAVGGRGRLQGPGLISD